MAAAKRYFSLLAAAVLAGCAVGPDYVRPDAAMPDRFIGQSAIEQRGATRAGTAAGPKQYRPRLRPAKSLGAYTVDRRARGSVRIAARPRALERIRRATYSHASA